MSLNCGPANFSERSEKLPGPPTTSLWNPQMPFELHPEFEPAGDQPKAIAELVAGLRDGKNTQVLMGVTGSGKTLTLSNVIQAVQLPILVIVHNKTLVRQLQREFTHDFPGNAVHAFFSCYDKFQPETYQPKRKRYIEQDGKVDQRVHRERLAAIRAVLTRTDVIIVASVSALYGLPSPEDYRSMALRICVGQDLTRDELINELIGRNYSRNDLKFAPGTFRLRGPAVDVFPLDTQHPCRIEFAQGTVRQLTIFRLVEGDIQQSPEEFMLFPSTYSGVPADKLDAVIAAIENEREQRVAKFEKENRPEQAERIDRRTQADLDALRMTGTCRGIQNYSRHVENRDSGTPPSTLLDYFPAKFLTIIDESHAAVNQIRDAGAGPRSNKGALVRNAFRLPSAADNRPLTLEEFEARLGQVIYVSATPGSYELAKAEGNVVEQIVRPTFLVDPMVQVVPKDNQTEHLLERIRERIASGERTLVITFTKRHAEELAASIHDAGIPCGWLHHDLKGSARVGQLRRLRQGHLTVLVGVNLLREGIDLPEVSLVAILDADKGGFLRSKTSLIQTIGRAARHVNGTALLYADRTTNAMRDAIDETNRRREIQLAFNRKHRKTPRSIQRGIN